MVRSLLSGVRLALATMAVGLLISDTSRAQADVRDVIDQQMSWYMLFGNHRLTDQLGLHTEYQFRRTGFGADWQQSLLRFGLDWHRDDQHVVTGGYGWIRSFPYGEQPIAETFDEHRLWQQLVTKSVTGQFKWVHRYRLEQRLMQFTTGSRWQHRVRLRRGLHRVARLGHPGVEFAAAKPHVRCTQSHVETRNIGASRLLASSHHQRQWTSGRTQPRVALGASPQLGFQGLNPPGRS
jgi:hypothetical protein